MAMPTFDALEPDLEMLPRGAYRGRGHSQENTGPSGPWLERGPARYLRPPTRASEEEPSIGPWPTLLLRICFEFAWMSPSRSGSGTTAARPPQCVPPQQ